MKLLKSLVFGFALASLAAWQTSASLDDADASWYLVVPQAGKKHPPFPQTVCRAEVFADACSILMARAFHKSMIEEMAIQKKEWEEHKSLTNSGCVVGNLSDLRTEPSLPLRLRVWRLSMRFRGGSLAHDAPRPFQWHLFCCLCVPAPPKAREPHEPLALEDLPVAIVDGTFDSGSIDFSNRSIVIREDFVTDVTRVTFDPAEGVMVPAASPGESVLLPDDARGFNMSFLPCEQITDAFNVFGFLCKSDATNSSVWQNSKLRGTRLTSVFYDTALIADAVQQGFPPGWWVKCTRRLVKFTDAQVVKGSTGYHAAAMVEKQLKSIGAPTLREVADALGAATAAGDALQFHDKARTATVTA